MRARRILGRALLATVVPLTIVEALLQLGAVIAAWRMRSHVPRSPDACEVLCVGDSYTYGIGASASEKSYPGWLETMLVEQPIDGRARVVNGGWPGRNSREILEQVSAQIEECRPRYLAVLVGVNDLWSRPDRVDVADRATESHAPKPSTSAFRFEPRLPRLVALIVRASRLRALRDAPPTADAKSASAPSPPPANPSGVSTLTGRWRGTAHTLELLADRSARLDGVDLQWAVVGQQLLLEDPSTHHVNRIDWRIENGELRLSLPGDRSPTAFRCEGTRKGAATKKSAPAAPPAAAPPPPESGAALSQAVHAAIGKREFQKAFELATRAIDAAPESAWCHGSLASAAMHLSRDDVVERELAWLRRHRAEFPDLRSTESLVWPLKEAKKIHEARQIAEEDLGRWPDSISLWTVLAECAETENDLAPAEVAIGHAIELDSGEDPARFGRALRLRARLRLYRGDVHGAGVDMLHALVVDDCEGEFRNAVRRRGMNMDARLIDDAGAELGVAPEKIARAKALLSEALDPGKSDAPEILLSHLQQLVRICRNRGVEPVILTYPFHSDLVEATQRRVAAESGLRLIEVAKRFDEELKRHAREELFVPDGHCTDLGYRFVAEEVAAALR